MNDINSGAGEKSNRRTKKRSFSSCLRNAVCESRLHGRAIAHDLRRHLALRQSRPRLFGIVVATP